MSNQPNHRKPVVIFLALLILGIAAAIAGAMLWQNMQASHAAPQFNGSIPSQPIPLADFSLVDTDNRLVSKADLKGGWHLLFFGFTSCPDICPNTLAALRNAKLQDVQIVMISVDPKRDNPKRLQSYLNYYGNNIMGLTGTPDNITELTRKLGVPIDIQPTSSGSYTVDHSASLWLLNPEANIAAKLSYPHQGKALSQTVPAIIQHLSQ